MFIVQSQVVRDEHMYIHAKLNGLSYINRYTHPYILFVCVCVCNNINKGRDHGCHGGDVRELEAEREGQG